MRRFVDWWRNPWGKPRFLAVFTSLPHLVDRPDPDRGPFLLQRRPLEEHGSGMVDTLVLGRAGPIRQERSLAPGGALPEPRARLPHDADRRPDRRGPRDFAHPLARARLGHRALREPFPDRYAGARDGHGALPDVRSPVPVRRARDGRAAPRARDLLDLVRGHHRPRPAALDRPRVRGGRDGPRCAAHEGAPARPPAVAPARDRGELPHRFRHLDRRLRHQPVPLRRLVDGDDPGQDLRERPRSADPGAERARQRHALPLALRDHGSDPPPARHAARAAEAREASRTWRRCASSREAGASVPRTRRASGGRTTDTASPSRGGEESPA